MTIQSKRAQRASAPAGSIEFDADVLVLGGGPAGTWAAISAAEQGARCGARFAVTAQTQPAAAQTVASAMPSEPLHYNPLYIHSAVGLGKTHLLQAIAHAAGAAKRRVTYLTAEKFMYVFVSALKSQSAIAFKEKLRAIDVLIIDDVQFLQGNICRCGAHPRVIEAVHQAAKTMQERTR